MSDVGLKGLRGYLSYHAPGYKYVLEGLVTRIDELERENGQLEIQAKLPECDKKTLADFYDYLALPEDVQSYIKRLEAFVRDMRDDYDCDEGAHEHNTMCRCCEAEKVIGSKE